MIKVHRILFCLLIQVLLVTSTITNAIRSSKHIPDAVSSKTCLINIGVWFKLKLLKSTSVSFYQAHPGRSSSGNTATDQASMISPHYPIYFVVRPQCKQYFDSTELTCNGFRPCSFMLQSDNVLIPPSSGWAVKDKPRPGEWTLEFNVNQDLFLDINKQKYSTKPLRVNLFVIGNTNFFRWSTEISIVGKIAPTSTFFCRRASTSVYRDKVILKTGDDFACFIEAKGYAAGSQNKKLTNINASLYDFEKPYVVPFNTNQYSGQERIADGELAKFSDFLYHTQESGIETDKSVKNPGSKTDISLIILNMTVSPYSISGRYCVVIEIRPNPGDRNGKREKIRGSKNSCFTYEAPPSYEWVVYLVVVLVLLSACAFVFFLKINK